MAKYHRCPKCGRPAKATTEAESFVKHVAGKMLRYICQYCGFSFWRAPGGLG